MKKPPLGFTGKKIFPQEIEKKPGETGNPPRNLLK